MVLLPSGRIRECSEPRDARVVGVLSGAGQYRPGLVLDRRPTAEAAGRRLPIALMGKVFCRMDARGAPIRPGDLLTTSDLPGDAMVLAQAERHRAVGAVLGKALAGLERGTGLVPMLVAPG